MNKVESARSGVVVGGTPDIIAVHPDRTVTIYDAKTGWESASHIIQVQLYMYLLPKSGMKRWRDKKFEGVVVYADGSERRVSADSVGDAFVSRLAEFMRKMTSHMPPRRVPSMAECNWCELTSADCQDKVNPRDVWSELYGMGRHTTVHLYAVPVLAAFDAIRNCSHCRRNTDDDYKTWCKLRKAVAVLRLEARQYVKGVDELWDATGGCSANIYQFACGLVAYFAPDAPNFQEVGELKGRF